MAFLFIAVKVDDFHSWFFQERFYLNSRNASARHVFVVFWFLRGVERFPFAMINFSFKVLELQNSNYDIGTCFDFFGFENIFFIGGAINDNKILFGFVTNKLNQLVIVLDAFLE